MLAFMPRVSDNVRASSFGRKTHGCLLCGGSNYFVETSDAVADVLLLRQLVLKPGIRNVSGMIQYLSQDVCKYHGFILLCKRPD